jgi:hypothetical protein
MLILIWTPSNGKLFCVGGDWIAGAFDRDLRDDNSGLQDSCDLFPMPLH